ncbi:MAG: hypothetical protein K0U98_01245 [Deltaproteobacteria bacterium]|nr:hypothetical protein [Deltaproteobacteria bacterium]
MPGRRTTATELAAATVLGFACLAFGGACSDQGKAPEDDKVSVAPEAAASKAAEEPVVTEDGELIFREDFEGGELPAGVIQGTTEDP